MNIVFIFDDDPIASSGFFRWRGLMLFEAIKRTGLHVVDLVSSTEFILNDNKTQNVISNKQFIIIEASPHIDLLKTVSYWKSRDKIVMVDIPIDMEFQSNNHHTQNNKSFSFSTFYTNPLASSIKELDQTQSFHWGLHLTDCILVSSPDQVEFWQTTAPVKIIPDYIDLDVLRDLVKISHKGFVIGVVGDLDKDKCEMLCSEFSKLPTSLQNIEWVLLSGIKGVINPKNQFNKMPNLAGKVTDKWPQPLAIIDLAIILSSDKVPGENIRNLLEIMAMKIPWLSNDLKSYRELSLYGCFVQDENNLKKALIDMLLHYETYKKECEESPYLYAISRNIDDHIHEILGFLSGFVKESY